MTATTPTPDQIPTVDECPPGHGRIGVYRETAPIPENMRWWDAEIRGLLEHVATYYAPIVCGEVCRAHVRGVAQLHPGPDVWLVYV